MDEISHLLERADDAAMQMYEFRRMDMPTNAAWWKQMGLYFLANAESKIAGYRRSVDRSPEGLEYLNGVVTRWERKVKELNDAFNSAD